MNGYRDDDTCFTGIKIPSVNERGTDEFKGERNDVVVEKVGTIQKNYYFF